MNEENLNDFKKAGRIAGEARELGASLIKEGALVVDILNQVEDFIISKDAGIAFPAQMSFNNIAAHACATQDEDRVVEVDDVIKLDVGAHVNGFIGDTATTVNLSGEYSDLIKASKDALYSSFDLFTAGTPTGIIGKNIQEKINDAGFEPVRNLSGHGLGQFQIHTKPSIPNIHLENSTILKEGMTVACEPFATDGKGSIAEHGEATVFSPTGATARVRSPIARELLKKIQTYHGLPFTTRWLSKEFGIGKTRLGLRELERANVIYGHPPLKEVANGIVSQREHSFYITDGKPIITTKLDDE